MSTLSEDVRQFPGLYVPDAAPPPLLQVQPRGKGFPVIPCDLMLVLAFDFILQFWQKNLSGITQNVMIYFMLLLTIKILNLFNGDSH